jgi:hypothetical protein
MVATPLEISHRQFYRKPSESAFTRHENAPATLFIGVGTPPAPKKFEKTRLFCSFLFTTASELRMIEVTEELKTFPQGPVLSAAETSSLKFHFTNLGRKHWLKQNE